MTKTISTILGFTMTLAMAGASFAAQGTPAPTVKPATSASTTTSSEKSTKVSKKGKVTKAKSTKKTVAATPAK